MSATRISPRTTVALLAVALFAVTLALTWRIGSFEFLNYDDDTYVTANPAVLEGLSPDGLRWALTSGHGANWHPVTWLSHQLDVTLFGLDAGAHHRTNAVLHALAAVLCFLTLHSLTASTARSLLVAALFALHPLRAESVAWVSERKDLLAGVFALATLLAYAAWTRRGGRARLGLCLVLLALGLASKPMGVTLPFLFLVLDAWPLGRTATTSWRRLILEKLPFLVLVAVSSVVTFLVQRAAGAVSTLEVIPFGARLANALRATTIYALETVWPHDIAAFHPHPALLPGASSPWDATALAAGLGLLAVAALALRLRQRLPALAAGLAWFAGMLVPVIGLVQVGVQGWAARYSYLPSIGLLIALVWTVAAVTPARARPLAIAASALAVLVLARAYVRQLDTWRDSRTVFSHALAVTESNELAHTNLAQTLEEAGDLEGAARHYQAALELRPHLAPVHVSLGRVLRLLGRPRDARQALQEALRLDGDSVAAHAELGWLSYEQGEDEAALEHLRRAVALAPDEARLVNNLAWALATGSSAAHAAEALALADRLCAASSGTQAGFLETRAAALARLGRFDEAVAVQRRALALVPASAQALLRERLRLYRAGEPYLRAAPPQR
jgi:Tfp pilus assembly protein PilF